MPKEKYIVDLGSTSVSIYHNGLVLKEPSIAVVRRGNGLELVAAGKKALELVGKLDDYSSLVMPIENGVVVNAEVASLMLCDFFAKVIKRKIFSPQEIIVSISSGLTIAERETLEQAIAKTGYKDITLVESILAMQPFVDSKGSAVILFGGGTTELGVIDASGIIAACSVNISGKTIDEKIAERILNTYNLKISSQSAEKLKIGIGSLYENDNSTMDVVGRDILDGKIKAIEVSAKDIRSPIVTCYKKIMEIIESLLTTIPVNMITDVTMRGIYIAGGGACMRGLAEYMSKYLKIAVHLENDEYPDTAVVRGLALRK